MSLSFFFRTSSSRFPSSCLTHAALASDFRTQDLEKKNVSAAGETTAPPAGPLKQKHLTFAQTKSIYRASRRSSRRRVSSHGCSFVRLPQASSLALHRTLFILIYSFVCLFVFLPPSFRFDVGGSLNRSVFLNEWRNVRWRLTGGPKRGNGAPQSTTKRSALFLVTQWRRRSSKKILHRPYGLESSVTLFRRGGIFDSHDPSPPSEVYR